EKRLHPVILRGSDHWLVLSLIEVTAALGIFKLAIIKGLGEHAVDHGPGNRLAAGFAALTRLELPILVAMRRISAGVYSPVNMSSHIFLTSGKRSGSLTRMLSPVALTLLFKYPIG